MGISTHVLDTAIGRPAANVPVALSRLDSDTWTPLHQSHTDPDGRIKHLLPESAPLTPGTYRVHFETSVVYPNGLYPYVEIVFTVSANQPHYHIPLLLTANGYTTYRGS